MFWGAAAVAAMAAAAVVVVVVAPASFKPTGMTVWKMKCQDHLKTIGEAGDCRHSYSKGNQNGKQNQARGYNTPPWINETI